MKYSHAKTSSNDFNHSTKKSYELKVADSKFKIKN